MLTRLSVKNFILIDDLEINLSGGLSIITGETGAGKSILLGALNLILGYRAETGNLLDNTKKCIIEADFNIETYELKSFFNDHELDYEQLSTVRRELSADGKSRSFINDTPVKLNILRELTEKLIDIHSQHETLLLNSKGFQLSVVDAYAGNKVLLQSYLKEYNDYKDQYTRLAKLRESENQNLQELDYIRFQYKELDEANLQNDELLRLEPEQERLSNASEISNKLEQVINFLSTSDDSIHSQLTTVQQEFKTLVKYGETFKLLSDRLNSLLIDLNDISNEIETASENNFPDPSKLELLQERLSSIYRLQQKHRLDSIEDLNHLKSDLLFKLEQIESFDENIREAEKKLELKKESVFKFAAQLHKARIKAIPLIEKEITSQLAGLAMPHASLKIELTDVGSGAFNSDGQDAIQFYFASNKGSEFREIQKSASGGELSRLMLCIKALLAKKTAMPTIIFDEIDSGISGETAAKTGSILRSMSVNHQVIAISHLPQIAARGHQHFFVFKEISGKKTLTRLRILNDKERVDEIARLLSGEQLTEAALLNARELLNILSVN